MPIPDRRLVASALPFRYTLVRTETAMRKKLSAIGNSLGIVIEKPILELLDITRETELDMTTDGGRLIIAPVRKGRKQRVKAAMDEIMADHAPTFRKLAR
jgi:antitoxin component of MazEF toxin-antitoxin module